MKSTGCSKGPSLHQLHRQVHPAQPNGPRQLSPTASPHTSKRSQAKSTSLHPRCRDRSRSPRGSKKQASRGTTGKSKAKGGGAKGKGSRFDDLLKQHRDKSVLKRGDHQELCYKFQDEKCTDPGCVRAHVCRLPSQHFVETVQVLEVRLKPNYLPGLALAARDEPKSRESGSAPKSQQRATLVSRAVFPRPLSFRVVSKAPCGSQFVPNSSRLHPLGVVPGTLGSEGFPLALSSVTSGHTRSAAAGVGPSTRTHGGP